MKFCFLSLLICLFAAGAGAAPGAADHPAVLTIQTARVLNRFDGPAPLGININFFTDNDHFLNPPRKLSAALREMGVKYLRYPGGDKSDYYLFSVPPYDRAIATPSQIGPGTNETRAQFFNRDRTAYNREVLNFDDYMTICREAGAQPVIVCGIDTYVQTREHLPQAIRVSTREDFLRNAVEWVRYANVKHDYHVKYWMLGNESWEAYYIDSNGRHYGYTPKMYAKDLVDFSAAMKKVDPSIKIIANGVQWTAAQYLPTAYRAIDYICTSVYPVSAATPIRTYQDWAAHSVNHGDLLHPIETLAGTIDSAPIPASRKSGLKVIASEFGPYDFWNTGFGTRQDLGHAMFNFDLAGQLLSDPRVAFSTFWNTRWVGHEPGGGAYDALEDNNQFTCLGQSLALWGNFLFPEMVAVSQAPAMLAYASYRPETDEVYLYVINQRGVPAQASLAVPGKEIRNVTKVAEMQGASPEAHTSTYSLRLRQPIPGRALPLDPCSITVFHVGLSPSAHIRLKAE